MKNKGFTLIEILAVIVILGIVVSIAMISVSRYRGEANKRDLVNLYSAVQTSYDNYRLSVLNKGDEPEDALYIKNGQLYTNDKFEETKSGDSKSVLRFFSDLAYSGDALASDKLEIIIVNRNKGVLLNKEKYIANMEERLKNKYGEQELDAMKSRLIELTTSIANQPNEDDKQALLQERNTLLQKLDIFYVKDVTCKIKSTISTKEAEAVTGDSEEEQIKTIDKWCERKTENITDTNKIFSDIVPSNTELLCVSLKSNGMPLIDDYNKKLGLYHNELCFTGDDGANGEPDEYWNARTVNNERYE